MKETRFFSLLLAVVMLCGVMPYAETKAATISLNRPLDRDYTITAREYYSNKEYHGAIDYGCPKGTPVYAAESGIITVYDGGFGDGYYGCQDGNTLGNYADISHGNGYYTRYAHMSAGRFVVASGTSVQRGQLIGYSGNSGNSTGPHLHFGLYLNGLTSAYKVYPEPYLKTATGYFDGGASTSPTVASLSIDKYEVMVGETFTLSLYADVPCYFALSITDAYYGEVFVSETFEEKQTLNQYSNSFLRAGHYIAWITAYNEQGAIDSNSVHFYVYTDPVDIGTEFTALIINTAAWKLVESDMQHSEIPYVRINNETRLANQLWYFERQDDGSYKISSCYDGTFLDVKDASYEICTPIQTVGNTNSDAQKWFIYEENGAYVFRSKLSGQVLDLVNNDASDGNTLQTYQRNDTTAQIWTIYRSDDTELKGPELTVSVGDDKSKTVFSWSSVYGAKDYALYIHRDVIGSGDFIPYKAGSATVAELDLPAGTYQAYVDSQHVYDYQMGNVVTFTVDEHSCEFESVRTESTCTTEGYIVYTCEKCGDTYEETIPAKTHTFVISSRTEETCEADGTAVWSCMYCDESYTETIPATGHDYQNNVCVNCGDTLIVEYGVELHVSGVQATAGETVTVDVILDKNVGFTYLNLMFDYDAEALELISVTNGTIVESLTQGRNYIWACAENASATGVLATLTFAVKENASLGAYAIAVLAQECCNADETDIAVKTENGTVTVVDCMYGDCTGDGEINGKDATRLLRYLANFDYGTNTSTVEISRGADCNGDGLINGKDVTRLLRYLAYLDPVTGESSVELG